MLCFQTDTPNRPITLVLRSYWKLFFALAQFPYEAEGMFAAMLFAISIVALSQFALYYWRAMLAGVAAQPVSNRTLEAAHVQNGHVTGQDFATLVRLHELTPELYRTGSNLGPVRLYYWVVDG